MVKRSGTGRIRPLGLPKQATGQLSSPVWRVDSWQFLRRLKDASFRLFVTGGIGVKEIERLIKKLELDEEILADQSSSGRVIDDE